MSAPNATPSTPEAVTPTVTPSVIARVTDSFNAQGFLRHIGARLGDITPGEVHLHVPVSEAVTQQLGFFHGGVIGALADTAGGYAAKTMIDDDRECVTVTYTINFLAPAVGDEIEAIGRVVKAGRNIIVTSAEVFCTAGDVRKHVATCQQTFYPIAPRPDAPVAR